MLGWFRALMPREDRFFGLFVQHAQTIVAAAEALEQLLRGGEAIVQNCQTIIRLENEADAITREVLVALRKTFITPFDRTDIKDLIQSMDDAIDTMQKAVKTILLYEQKSFDPRMREMGGLIVKTSRILAGAIPLLKQAGANAARLAAMAEEVTRIEGQVDELHDQGLKALFERCGETRPMAYIIGSEIYGQLEKVMDRFEDVANEISGIVIENV